MKKKIVEKDQIKFMSHLSYNRHLKKMFAQENRADVYRLA